MEKSWRTHSACRVRTHANTFLLGAPEATTRCTTENQERVRIRGARRRGVHVGERTPPGFPDMTPPDWECFTTFFRFGSVLPPQDTTSARRRLPGDGRDPILHEARTRVGTKTIAYPTPTASDSRPARGTTTRAHRPGSCGPTSSGAEAAPRKPRRASSIPQ